MNVSEQPFYFQATIKLLLAGLIIAFLILAQNILIPLTIAIFFTFLLMPVSRRLEQWHIPKALSILLSIILGFCYCCCAAVLFCRSDFELCKRLAGSSKSV